MENKEKNTEKTAKNQQDTAKSTDKKGKFNKIKRIIALVLCFAITFAGGYFSKYVFDSSFSTTASYYSGIAIICFNRYVFNSC